MPKSLNPIRPLVFAASAVAVAVAVAACGTNNADPDRGRVLFIQNCGTCHVMAQAGTTAEIGPNLDQAFASARAAGMDGDTIEGITAAQIENPRPSTDNPTVSMPADLVSGNDLEDVAAYVGEYAGVPGAAPPKVPGGPGAQVFANNGCGGCHTLAAASAGGVVGPNLDEVLPGQSAAQVEQSIADPNAKESPGYPLNVMPQNYASLIPADQIQQLVEYLLSEAGGPGNAAAGAGGPGAAGAGN